MKKWIVKISSLLFISALIIVSYAHDTMQNQSILGNGVAGQAGREEYGWIINESRHAGTSNITYKIDNISMTNADYILATYVGANRWNNTNTVTVYSSANSPNTVRAEALLNPNGTINTRTVAYFEGLTYQSNNNTNRHYASWEIVINTNNDSSFDCETEGAAVMAHEFGHAFGLVDLYLWGNRDKIMYYDVSGHAEEPHEDDKIGVKIITGQHGTGTPSPHNHNGVVQQPNYPGYHAITCTDCKAIRIDPTNSLRMLEECTFTKYYQLGDTTHGLECIDCGDKPTGLVEDHTWGQNNHFNNHSHTKQCTVCGINRLEPHNYRIKGSLHQGLYKECTDCGWIVDNVVNNDYDEVIHGDVNITTATSYSYEKILYTGNVTIHAPVSLNMSDVVVLGTLNINNGASLVINNNSTMHTSGDFLIQAKNNNGEFVATTGYVALGTGTKLTVSGDFYTQTTNSIHFSNGDPNDPAILELHGNFNQLGTNTFFNHANENGFKLVFAVNGEQRVRTDRNDVNANLGMIEVNHSELYFDTPIYQLWVAHDTIVNGNINARIIKNPNCVLEINGDFVVNQLMWIYDETIVTGMVLVQNGHLLVCNTNLTVGGDFRIQASNGQGGYTSTGGFVNINGNAKLTVYGDFYTQTITNGSVTYPYLHFSNGDPNDPAILELHGNFNQLGTNTFFNHANENGFKLIFAGNGEQRVRTDRNDVNANLGMIDINHNQVYFDTPIYQLWVTQNTIVNGNINARIIKNPNCVLKINGDLIVNQLMWIYDETIVTGMVLVQNGHLLVCNTNLTVGGDFRIQASNGQGGYTSTGGFVNINGNAKLTVYGDFYTQTLTNGSVTYPYLYFSNGDPNDPAILELHGNFNQLGTNTFFGHANENGFKLVFAGNGEQRVRTDRNDVNANLGMIEVNHSELYFDTPIYQLWVAQNTIVNGKINAQIIKNPGCVLEINGDFVVNQLMWIYDEIIVTGMVLVQNGHLLVWGTNLTVGGDFRIQGSDGQGGYTTTWGFVNISGNAKLTVYGDFYTQTLTNGSVTYPYLYFSNGDPNDPAILELHGNFNQLGTNTFFNHAIENGFKLIFAGNEEQRVRTDRNDVNANLGMIEVNHSELYFDTPIYQLWVAQNTIVNGNINARIIKNPNCVLKINGDLIVNQLMWIYDETIVTGMVLVQNGHLLVCNTNLTVGGDFRIQASNGQGGYTSTGGFVNINGNAKLTVYGDFYTQTLTNGSVTYPYLYFSNGDPNDPAILELHGNFNQIGTNTFFNHAIENGFKLIFAGNGEQRVRTDRNDQWVSLGRISKTNGTLHFITPTHSITALSNLTLTGNIAANRVNKNGYTVTLNGIPI